MGLALFLATQPDRQRRLLVLSRSKTTPTAVVTSHWGNLFAAAFTTGDSNIDIANNVVRVAGEANTLRVAQSIFTTFIAGIRGVTTGNTDAIPVLIDSAGQVGTLSSSRRFKHDIKPMDEASEAILALKRLAFH
jgi:hypothetical protein